MKKWIIFPVLLFLLSCKREKTETYFTPEKASQYFKSIENLCTRDNGRLWGKNLFGPLMFVDRPSRRIVANQPDNEGLLKGKDGIYSGFYPKELIINNAPVKFGGVLFAMTPLPPQEDDYRIKTQAIHSLFHRFQETRGIPFASYNTINMDEKEARLWIKLEWKALRKALNSHGEERQLAIRDALIFRGSNRELYQKFASDENRVEAYEGLATFTLTMFCTKSPEEYKTKLFEYLDRIYNMSSFARSYGFINGALYATLLYDKGFDFQKIQLDNIDLGKAVKELYNIELPVICRDVGGSLAVNYNIDAIIKEEETRRADIQDRIHRLISTFTEKPVVFLELESPYFGFEPEDIHPLDTLGTLYSSMRISDNWGKLTVDKGGCLVSNNYKFLRITAKGFKTEKNHISGEGWQLIMNSNWELVPVEQNYYARKLMP
ncbi:MAG: hypothetical protein EPN88_00945 [Bacteroidetes bacterium]|nr:MAG: hypothetical protein EPN88_00945 [Bacteroidota bacterium]